MSGLRQRSAPTRSRHYLDGAKDQTCLMNITGVCTGGPAVSMHIRDEHHGRSVKASDLSTCDGCQACHDVFDGRTHQPLTEEEWQFYALRGLQRTLERRREQGRLIVRIDAQTLSSERPVKPRKDKADRAPIANRGFQAGPKQKIQSRGFARKSERETS